MILMIEPRRGRTNPHRKAGAFRVGYHKGAMKVLVIGSGGREHAICRALARSRRLTQLFVLPGNIGTETLGTNVPAPRKWDDPLHIKLALRFAQREKIDLTIVGPEDPLAGGIVDAFEAAGLRIFGPTAAAARLESDKAFAKQIMRQQAVPTAEARIFDDYELAAQFISTRDDAVVIKAAGLAKGKGVIVCPDPPQALITAEKILKDRIFGDAGATIVVEERLEGPEVSVMAIVDGRTVFVLDPAQDYKRLRDGDEGPNTGGMGSFSPSTQVDDATMRHIESQVFVPVLDALIRDGIYYRGVLYAGLMLTAAGPKVLEFNCRFGDPETQALLPRLKTDFLDLIEATVDGKLEQARIEWDRRAALCVVMASQGYPDTPRTGVPITGLPTEDPSDDVSIFHAATGRDAKGRLVTTGGRVLGVTALGDSLAEARTKAYSVVDRIRFAGAQVRRDLGLP